MGLTRLQPGACCGCGGCSVTVCAKGCPGGTPLAGATVTIAGAGTCTTVLVSSTACCGIGIPGAGTYSVSVGKSGYKTWTGNVTVSCGDTISVTLRPDTDPATVQFTVSGCCSQPLAGATITLSDGQSCTTDAAGQCSFWIGDAGTYTYSVSKSRWATATGSFSIGACGAGTTSISVSPSPATGYVCGAYYGSDTAPVSGIADPIPEVLNLTDSVYGNATLTWNGAGQWQGSATGSYPGSAACNCPASTVTISYTLNYCQGGSPGQPLSISWNQTTYKTCPFNTVLQTHCPGDDPLANCVGHTGNFLVGGPNAYPGPGLTWSVPDSVPYSFTGTSIACNCKLNTFGDNSCAGVNGAYGGIPWESGGTFTISE